MLEINLNIMKMENGKMIERFIILCAAQMQVLDVYGSPDATPKQRLDTIKM